MKKILISLSVLSISFSTFASFLVFSSPIEVSIPSFRESFFVGAGLAYMEPTATDADFLFGFRNNGDALFANPRFDWGWVAVDVGYIFPETGNDITLDYWHFGSQDYTRATLGVTSIIFPVTVTNEDPSIQNLALQTDRLTSKPEFDFNQVDLTVGQYVDVGCRLQLHPNVGLQFSRINQKIDNVAFYSLTGTDNDAGFFNIPVTAATSGNSTFNGLGPRIDFDADYYLGNGFDVVGQFASAILVGNFTSRLAVMIDEPGGAPLPIGGDFVIPKLMAENSFSTFLKPHIVTNLEGKFALNYTYWVNGDISHLVFTAGYQVDEYFNSLDYFTTSGNLDRPAPVTIFEFNFAPGLSTHHMADFGFHGPFVGLKLYF